MRIWHLLLASLLFISGCNNNNEATEINERNLVRVKNSNIPEVERHSGQEIAQHLVDITTGIPNVKDATAVVLGPFAFVGIDVDANIDRSQVGSIKYTVAETLKDDPQGARAVVIADPDITARLKEIAEDIRNGKPIQGIMNELADISGRLMPEVPADLVEPNTSTKKTVEDPKKQLNKSEEKNLEKNQVEQSNHHKY
jgi:YhcN/YlaJ family sporulation lipoprotein